MHLKVLRGSGSPPGPAPAAFCTAMAPKKAAKVKAKSKAAAAQSAADGDDIMAAPDVNHQCNVDYLAKVQDAWATINGHPLFENLSCRDPLQIEAFGSPTFNFCAFIFDFLSLNRICKMFVRCFVDL